MLDTCLLPGSLRKLYLRLHAPIPIGSARLFFFSFLTFTTIRQVCVPVFFASTRLPGRATHAGGLPGLLIVPAI